ncbi:protease modulator HflC [Trinickia dinghuensis]|uniref:Protein HflC n=1 Tax=Trinickia dinghuensis TaxID=2291023 RepID=A0A3D8JQS4_9BURK|nr:protease modulator HflC [Trinickia dinghuensis]RDU95378.1 protease modulator HflC [Trinickia dinghuensis]
MNRIIALVIVVVAVLFAGASTLLVVDQRHVAVVYARGGEHPALVGPGLHVKLPTPLQSAMLVDTRVRTLAPADADRFVTSDKTDLLVTPVLKYRVTDPLKLFGETGGDQQSALDRLTGQMRTALGDAFAKRALADALSHEGQLAQEAQASMTDAAKALGIDIVDLSLVRVDLPQAGADAVYKRMAAAQEQIAGNERSQSATEVAQIKADAEHQREAVLADAYATAQAIKGEGDAKAASIAADAFGSDPGFYQFYESLQAYRSVFKPGDVIVVDPDSEFFRFMRSPDGSSAQSTPAPSASRKH